MTAPVPSDRVPGGPAELSPRGSRWPRRKFLVGGGAVVGAGAVGLAASRYRLGGADAVRAQGGLSAPAGAAGSAAPGGSDAGPLVLIALYGGNDGLNTVIPYNDPLYLQDRADLGYQPEQVLVLGDGLGLHPNLTGLRSLWDAGHLAIVRGVGYPDPVLSHFEGMAIWQSASPTGSESTGWLGRWLDATGDDPLRAVTVGPTLPLMMAGEKVAGAAVPQGSMKLPGGTALRNAFTALNRPSTGEAALAARTAQTGLDLLNVQSAVTEALAAAPSAGSVSSDSVADGSVSDGSSLGAQLDLVAQLIEGGLPTRVYTVSMNGFDTHSAEKDTHASLMAELDGAVSSFVSRMQTSDKGRGVVVATFSEFGRRVVPNASGGTDHGTASPLFVTGPAVKGGFYGDQPSLSRLDMGNLDYTTDFRSVYATLLDHVVGVDPSSILDGRFPTLDFV